MKIRVSEKIIPYDLDRQYIPKYIPFSINFNLAIRGFLVRNRILRSVRQVPVDEFIKSGVVFIHIPKNAGSSIVNVLYGNPIPHNSAQYYNLCMPGILDLCFSFAILRNPVDRFVSAFFYLKQGGNNHIDKSFSLDFLSSYASPNELAREMLLNTAFRNHILSWSHFSPQYKFILDQNGNLMVKELFLMNQIATIARMLTNVLGRQIVIPHINQSLRSGDESVDIATMRQIYQIDFELFDTIHKY